MVNGKWMFDASPIQFDVDGKLINGQHRMRSLIKSNTSQTFLIVLGLDNETFKVMDTGRNRQASDVFSIAGIPNYKRVSTLTSFVYVFKNTKQ